MSKTTKNVCTASAVLDSYKKYLFISIISEDGELNCNLSLENAVNLLDNIEAKTSIVVRKNTPDDGDKPRPAIFATYLGNDMLRVAIGKTNADIKKASDLKPFVDYKISNLELFMQASNAHMTNMESYKEFKNLFFKQYQKSGSGIVLQ